MNLVLMLHELQFSCRVRKNLYIVFGFFAYLCFSVYSLFPFHLFQLPWSLASDFFRSKTCRLYYLSFSILYHATSDVCFQEKSQNLKNSPCFSSFLKMWTSLQNLSAFSKISCSFILYFSSFHLSFGRLFCWEFTSQY